MHDSTRSGRLPGLALAALAGLALALPPSASALSDDFAAPLSAAWNTPRTEEPGSSVTAPVADPRAADGQALQLVFPSGTDSAHASPAYATEVQTTAPYGYGTFEARLRTGKASRRTGLVTGFFTYFNDGADHDLDGIVDNHEIDFEFLASEPTSIYMTVWTEYEDGVGGEVFRKTTRKVNLKTGEVWQTPTGGEGSYDLVPAAPLGWTARRFRASRAYAKYRFTWAAGSVEYAIDLEDGLGWRTLWTLTGVANDIIPSIPAPLFFNTWHNAAHWDTGLDALPPKKAAVFSVDSVTVN